MPNKKIRVAVLYGGRSTEHEVSLQTAKSISANLDQGLFEVVPIGIDKKGGWFLGDAVFEKSLECNQVVDDPKNPTWFATHWLKAAAKRSADDFAREVKPYFDVIFPALHGSNCEDGALQGLLELAQVPYVGANVLASAIGFDKDIAKRLVAIEGIPIANYFVVKHAKWRENLNAIQERIVDQLQYPVFVKPANAGSSVGINKVSDAKHLEDALNKAFQIDNKVLIEEALQVAELEIAVLENLIDGEKPIVSVVGEINPHREFYSYAAKYLDADGADLIIPTKFSETIQQEAQQLARKIFSTLECEGMARVDLFYDKIKQRLVFNEINTLPGFTNISMYPKLMAASNMPYKELLTHLIKLAFKKHKYKNQLVIDYIA